MLVHTFHPTRNHELEEKSETTGADSLPSYQLDVLTEPEDMRGPYVPFEHS